MNYETFTFLCIIGVTFLSGSAFTVAVFLIWNWWETLKCRKCGKAETVVAIFDCDCEES